MKYYLFVIYVYFIQLKILYNIYHIIKMCYIKMLNVIFDIMLNITLYLFINVLHFFCYKKEASSHFSGYIYLENLISV